VSIMSETGHTDDGRDRDSNGTCPMQLFATTWVSVTLWKII